MNSRRQLFNTALYLRLSKDDGTDKESESIQNQKAFLQKYAAENNLLPADTYIDDGWSGTDFNRPDFKRLIHDIDSGKINCVITKDLSRLGRDYIMTGYYIEKYFPEHNVRYIAVNDGVDTFANSTNNDITPFKAVLNDMYAKDISKKVRTALDTKKSNGEFIGSVAPYGYKKDPDNKHKLIIDEPAAANVRRIFSMYLDGCSAAAIARTFTNEHIPTPSKSRHLTATQQEIYNGIWNPQIIRRMLSNPTYIGNLTQNRAKKLNYKLSLKKNLPAEEWVIVENTHEPIILAEDYDMVQKIIQMRTHPFHQREHVHLLAGLLRCSDCGKNMTFVSDRDGRSYIVCSAARRYYQYKLCTPHRIREDYVEREVIEQLKEQAQRCLNREKMIADSIGGSSEQALLNKTIAGLEKRAAELSGIITSLYIDKSRGIITETDFITISSNLNSEKENISRQLSEAHERRKRLQRISGEDARKYLDSFLSFHDVSRNTLLTLVDRVVVYNDKTFKIYFNFKR